MKHLILAAAIVCSLGACSNDDNELDSSLLTPTGLAVEVAAGNTVTLRWKDNNDHENGYIISQRDINGNEYTEIGKVDANVTSFSIEQGLQESKSYYFSVKAYTSGGASYPATIIFKKLPASEMPGVTIANAKANATCVSISYQVKNIELESNLKYGLCWAEEQTPTINDQKQAGPVLTADGQIFQVIPNVLLEYGKTYKVRAYATSAKGTFYSAESNVKLEAEVPAVTLTWNKLTKSVLPSEVELYETTSTLNGRNFHAWYAIGDLASGKVEVRVNMPAVATTIDNQVASFNGDCYLMVNGGYFYNGKHTGISVIDSKFSGSVPEVRGSLKSTDEEYNVMYKVTRAAFGVDASGKPGVCWAGSDAKGTYYFDRPLPTVKGESKYGELSSTSPASSKDWAPKYALSAGPVLLKDGKIPFDFTLTAKGTDFYLSNYEVMPYDIFGTGVKPDRTAVGYREDGKVILFICDGRIAASDGATLVELAQIMKGLGCVGAINLDGGGSTAMVVGTEHLNDQAAENRPVVTSIGFFKKK